jgi:hypothetical protein
MNIQLCICGSANAQKETACCKQAGSENKQTALTSNLIHERLKVQRRIERALAAGVQAGMYNQSFALWVLDVLKGLE